MAARDRRDGNDHRAVPVTLEEHVGSRRLRKLRAEDFDPFDDRRRREQVRRLCHQRLRDRSIEVSLSPGFVSEGVEDAKR